MTCAKCKTYCPKGVSTVQGLCSSCFGDVKGEVNSRGFDLSTSPKGDHPNEFRIYGVKFWYWREWWRAEAA